VDLTASMLTFYNNCSLKRAVAELEQGDRQTDGPTEGSQHCIMPPPYTAAEGHNNPLMAAANRMKTADEKLLTTEKKKAVLSQR